MDSRGSGILLLEGRGQGLATGEKVFLKIRKVVTLSMSPPKLDEMLGGH